MKHIGPFFLIIIEKIYQTLINGGSCMTFTKFNRPEYFRTGGPKFID